MEIVQLNSINKKNGFEQSKNGKSSTLSSLKLNYVTPTTFVKITLSNQLTRRILFF